MCVRARACLRRAGIEHMAAGGLRVLAPLVCASTLLQVGGAAVSRDRVLMRCQDGEVARSVAAVRCDAAQAAAWLDGGGGALISWWVKAGVLAGCGGGYGRRPGLGGSGAGEARDD